MTSKYIIELISCYPIKKIKRLSYTSKNLSQQYYITDVVPVFMKKILPLITFSNTMEEARRFDSLREAQKFMNDCALVGVDSDMELTMTIHEVLEEDEYLEALMKEGDLDENVQ